MVATAKHFVTVRGDWPKVASCYLEAALSGTRYDAAEHKTATRGATFEKAHLQAEWPRFVERVVFEDLGWRGGS